MIYMLGKCLRVPISLVALGLLVGVAVTAAATGRPVHPEITGASAEVGHFEPQNATTSSNVFGLTVADIYDRGVIVMDVDFGSGAGMIGIRKGDVILAVNGEPILGTDQFHNLVHEFVARSPVRFTVSRFGLIHIFTIDTP